MKKGLLTMAGVLLTVSLVSAGATVTVLAEEETTLVYGSGDYTRINPAMDEHGEINILIFNGLTAHDGDNQVVPGLAESWDFDDETNTYTFHMAEDAKWQDGEPVTAEDVKFTIEAIMDPENGSENAPNYEDVEEITVIDDSTVSFRLSEPNVAFLEYMTMAILPKHLLEGENMQESDFFHNAYTGDGLKIEEIIAKGPLTLAGSQIKKGCIIEKIDGTPIKKDADYYPLLSGKVGKKVMLSVYDPTSKQRFEEQVKAISNGELSNLLYKRWIENCQETVDKLSNGQIGYVHVRGMNSESFREVYSALLGRCRNKKAVIVDTRHNGGGWLHDDLATLLSGKEYQRFEPRGQYIGSDPYNKWTKPSCVLMCEDNYSNAHGFPWVYKTLGIGKLIGAPVPGTMTAVWWETQIDPTLVFGIPQVGVKDMQGNYLENQQLQPDVEVYNTPEAQLSGEDTQLKRAVEVMLQTVK